MPVTSFTLIDRANQKNKITVDEDNTIGQIMDQFFSDKHYTMQMIVNRTGITIDRSEIIKKVLKKGIMERGEVKYKLIHTQEFIDVHINPFTQSMLNIYTDNCRIYCTDDTTVFDIEKDLSEMYNRGNELGLYGFLENREEKVFKLKGDDHVLFMKRCFSAVDFFQYQFNNCIEAIQKLEVTYESKFYRLDYPEQKIFFKTTHKYSLRGTSLVKMKKGVVIDCFYDIHDASITIQKYFAKNILVIKNSEKTWRLCTFSENICHEMYQALLSCKSNNTMRKVNKTKEKKLSRKSPGKNLDETKHLDKIDKMLDEIKISRPKHNKKSSNLEITTKIENKNNGRQNKKNLNKEGKESTKIKADLQKKIGKRERIAVKKEEKNSNTTLRDMNFFQKFFSPTKAKMKDSCGLLED